MKFFQDDILVVIIYLSAPTTLLFQMLMLTLFILVL